MTLYTPNTRRATWHRWFAWHPAQLPDGRVVWLETIERKGEWCGGHVEAMVWDYRSVA